MSSNRMDISNLLSPNPTPEETPTPRQEPQYPVSSQSPPVYNRSNSASASYAQYHQSQLQQQHQQHYPYSSPAYAPPAPSALQPPLSTPPAGSVPATAKKVGTKSKRKEAPLLQRAVTSPKHYDRSSTPSLPHSAVVEAQQIPAPSLTSSSTISSLSAITPGTAGGHSIHSAASTPGLDYRTPLGYGPVQSTPPGLPRQASTEKMNFLAGQHSYKSLAPGSAADQESTDVASMQQAQQTQVRSIRTSVHDLPRSPQPQPPPLSRRTSAIPTPGDHMMSDAPTALLQHNRTFRSSSLTQSELQSVSELTKQLSENSFLYDTHTKLIKILQEGLRRHILPPTGSTTLYNPQDYALLPELRQARDAMDSRFPVGEELWIQWIQDEAMLAQTIEDRMAVMELCQKATSDEVGSTKLWRLYGDWMWHLFKTAYNVTGVYEGSSLDEHPIVGQVLARQQWTEDDKAVGAEAFGWETMLNVWRMGVKATEWHINDSHVVWDPLMDILLQDLASRPSSQKVDELKLLFNERLRTPHATWDDTSQTFSQFISRYDNTSYEMIMVETNRQAAPAKNEFALRQDMEQKLAAAQESGDVNAEWTTMAEYLDWEASQTKKRNASRASFDLFIGLFERAHLRFPTDSELWEDHIDVITEHPRAETHLIPLTYNATRHCPWSGSLWAKRLIALEVAGSAFEEMEDTKHHATSTGLLEEIGGVEELVKVQTAWCGFLRRRAFSPNAGEDEADMAEVGIRSALEEIKALGEKKEGKNFKGDPNFRVQRIYIKFLSQAGRLDESRQEWKKLIPTHGFDWEFWEKWYTWEVSIWSRSAPGKTLPPPEHATAVLLQAIRRPDLNWPAKMIEMYLHHVRQHETAQRVQEAHVEARRQLKVVAKRQAEAAAEQAAAEQQYEAMEMQHAAESSNKRKLEDVDVAADTLTKRPRGEVLETIAEEQPMYEASSSATSQIKRDRENTTVIVKNIPASTNQGRVRQYFRDCGFIHTVSIVPDENNETATATLEFDTKEDTLSAMTRNMRTFDGNEIEIQIGTGTTLYVSNYPPEADETYIRNLFSQFGDIVEVRFPSLKFDTHRRFCYVQFLTSSSANAATSLDGKALAGNRRLQAKISDPNAKKDREGATREGREVYVKNVDWSKSEDDVRTLFEPYGKVDSVRIPRNMGGKSKGFAFVVFSNKEGAENAVGGLHNKEYANRILHVEISSEKGKGGAKRQATTIIRQGSSAPPESACSPMSTNANDNDSTPSASAAPATTDISGGKDHHARTLRLRNIPDTVNDARIRALAEQYGPLRQVKLWPQKSEALVEFEYAADVGKAEMALQGFEIIRGVSIEVGAAGGGAGTLTGGPGKGKGIQAGNGTKAIGGAMPFAPVTRRPVQGKRGGLGFKRGGSAITGDRKGSVGSGGGEDVKMEGVVKTESDDTNGVNAGKSNDDFRKLLAGGK